MSLEIEQIRRLANTVIVNPILSKVASDPAANLSDLLRQQASSYPRLIANLKSSSSQNSAAKKTNDAAGTALSRFAIPNGHPIDIVEPLSSEVCELLSLDPEHDATTGLHDSDLAHVVATLSKHIENGEILHELYSTVVVGIGSRLVLKISPSLDLDEITNLRYINRHVPEIPTPRCLGAFVISQRKYVFMSRAGGRTLEQVWPDLSDTDKISIRNQLTHKLQHLHNKSLQVDTSNVRIGSFISGVCKDMRRETRSSSSIKSEEEFNDFLCTKPGRTNTPWIKMIRSFMGTHHRLVMAHGDLHPRNVMVLCQTDGQSVPMGQGIRLEAILDWEVAGWYPEYWDFMKALHTLNMRSALSDWVAYLPTEAIGQFPAEYSIDCLIDRWLG